MGEGMRADLQMSGFRLRNICAIAGTQNRLPGFSMPDVASTSVAETIISEKYNAPQNSAVQVACANVARANLGTWNVAQSRCLQILSRLPAFATLNAPTNHASWSKSARRQLKLAIHHSNIREESLMGLGSPHTFTESDLRLKLPSQQRPRYCRTD